MIRFATTLVLLAAATGLLPSPAHAQVQRSGGGETQKFMQQYQQLAGEKTALQTELAQMKKDLDAAKADLAAMKKERDALKGRAGMPQAAVAKLAAEKETAEKNLDQSKQRMKEIVDRYRELGASLKDVETDRTKARRELDERNAAYDKCAENNLQLFELGNEVLNRYEHVGPFTKISAAEPFTKLTRTRIQNLVDEYRGRAEQLRIKKAAPANRTPASPTAAAPATGR